uniref:5'-nucleotidase n=1 Tax=Enterobius vermicularis TaxID=51028 RepID=A0A0N4V6U0_ENTVE
LVGPLNVQVDVDIAAVEKKIKRIIEDGVQKLMVISDFDYTISRYRNSNGEKCWTSYGVFETSNSAPCLLLSEKCNVLKDKYVTIEYDPCMSIEEKTPYMEEWFVSDSENYNCCLAFIHTVFFIQCVRDSKIELRDGTMAFFETLDSCNVPLIIFSAGIGNVIEIFLKQKFGKVLENVHIISNLMEFDQNGYVKRFLEPLIHTFCKNASVLDTNLPVFKNLSDRTNVILMGDSLGDLDMDTGVANKGVVLKIGFLNFNVSALLDAYLDGFDIVLIDDQSMGIPQHIFQLVCTSTDYLSENSSSRKLCKFLSRCLFITFSII